MTDWIWPQDALKNTPSIRAGITREQEALYRREGTTIIYEICSVLNVKTKPTGAVGSVYFHRFYMNYSLQQFPREITALGCFFLAGKVEEFPKKCKDVCNAAMSRFPEIFRHYNNLADEVMGIERVLLHVLKFDLQLDLAYDSLLSYAEFFPHLSEDQKKEVTQIAWTFVNDSYHTTLCLTLDPQMIAIALLHLAFTVKSIPPIVEGSDPCWWTQDISNWPVEAVDKSCHLVLDFYSALKEDKPLSNGRLTPF